MSGFERMPAGFGVDLGLLLAPDRVGARRGEPRLMADPASGPSSARRPNAALLAALDRGFDAESAQNAQSPEDEPGSVMVISVALGTGLALVALLAGLL